jgi:hypothetical protein
MLTLPENVRAAFLGLAERSDLLILGKLHGTQEVPQLVAALLDDLTARGYGGLGMELPAGEMGDPDDLRPGATRRSRRSSRGRPRTAGTTSRRWHFSVRPRAGAGRSSATT